MKQEKLNYIIDVARNMFARYGLRKTNIDELAHMARVAKATIYNYFGSKDSVYLAVLKKEADEIIGAILDSIDKEALPPEKLIALVKTKFNQMPKALNLLNLEIDGAENRYPDSIAIRNDLFWKEVEIIQDILEEGLAKGFFYIKNIMLASKSIGYAIRGFERDWLLFDSRDRIDHYLDYFLNIIIKGLMSANSNKTDRFVID